MRGTMQDIPLTINSIFRHGRTYHADSVVRTMTETTPAQRTFSKVGDRVERLAGALRSIGVSPGDRVATLCWNHSEHLETYFAVPSLGAVLLTLNLRLSPDQLTHIGNHAQPQVLIVDASLAELAAQFVRRTPSIKHVIVIGSVQPEVFGPEVHDYEQLVAKATPVTDWPDLDETEAAIMCYTTGTTGAPKGVAYTHRSTYLHSLATCTGNAFALSELDRILVVVPMFHANAWGLPYAGWLMGADLLMPREFLQGNNLAHFVETEHATFAAAVPTVLSDVLTAGRAKGHDLSSLRMLVGGGSAVPPRLIRDWRNHFGVTLVQGWGMTETSPLAALARVPKGVPADETDQWLGRTGRPVAGVEMRLVDESGVVLLWDDKSVGEVQVRGPWVTGEYFATDTTDDFSDGWLRTGDIGRINRRGYLQITDRAKDVIKSGGEWISSVELENLLVEHPGVESVAVIGIADERWQERPLACVVLRDEDPPSIEQLAQYLAARVTRWSVPDRWAILDEIPKTSVGKLDKNSLRQRYREEDLGLVVRVGSAQHLPDDPTRPEDTTEI